MKKKIVKATLLLLCIPILGILSYLILFELAEYFVFLLEILKVFILPPDKHELGAFIFSIIITAHVWVGINVGMRIRDIWKVTNKKF